MSQLHPIIEKLRKVQATEKKWLMLFSISLFLAFGLLAWLLACLLDFTWRNDQTWIRASLSFFPALVLGYCGWKLLIPSFRFQRSLVEVAKALESSHPSLKSQLSLATDFLSTSTVDGSTELRTQLIEQAQSSLQSVDLARQIKTAHPLRASAFLAAVFVTVGIFFFAYPRDSLFAARRSLSPLTPFSWPSVNDLQFVDAPGKIAIGDKFNCVVIDRNGRLPETVFLEIDDSQGILKREMKIVEDQAEFEISNLLRSFRIRAIGGDAKTVWHRIEVVTAPSIKEMTIQVIPPAYSGLAQTTVRPFEKIWAGSQIQIKGITDKPISKSTLILEPIDSEQLQSKRRKTRSTTLNRKNEFVFPQAISWTLNETVQFKAELTGQDNLIGGRNRNFRIPVRADNAPIIDLAFTNGRRVFGQRDRVALRLNAEDDMRIRSISLIVKNKDMQKFSVQLKVDSSPSQPANSTDRHRINRDFVLDLARLNVDPSETLEVVATVTDQSGKKTNSNPLGFRIGSQLELANLSANLRKEIFVDLANILNEENRAKNLLSLVLQSTEDSTKEIQRGRISEIAKTQQKIQADLFGVEGVLRKCQEFVNSISAEIELSEEEITGVMNRLASLKIPVRIAATQANESLALFGNPAVSRSCLEAAGRQQDLIIEGLAEIVGQIDLQTRLQNCISEIRAIIVQESEIRQQCLQLQTEPKQNSAGQIQSKRLSVEQNGISNRLNELSWGLLNDAKQLNSRPLKELGQKLKVVEIESKKAAEQIINGQPGLAFKTITGIIDDLKNALEQSNSTSPANPQVTKDQFDAAQSSFQSIQAQHSEIAGRMDDWSNLDSSQKKQVIDSLDKLKKRIANFMKENEGLLDENAKKLLTDSSQLLDEIKNDLGDNRMDAARLKMRELQNKLDGVDRLLDAESQQVAKMLRQDRFRNLQQEFALWLDSQTKVQVVLQASADLTPEVFVDLAKVQNDLTARIQKTQTENTDFYALVAELKNLESQSSILETHLNSNHLEPSRRDAAEMIKQIDALLDSGKKKVAPPKRQDDSKSSDSKSTTENESQIQISSLEVQLLRQMQEQILVETKRIELLREKKLSGQERAQLQKATLALADRQSELINTLKKYLKPPEKSANQKNEIPTIPEIPDIPDIPDELPEIPEFECGWFEPTSTSNYLDQEKSEGNSKSENDSTKTKPQEAVQQEKDKPQVEQPKIQSIRPFAPKGQKTDDEKQRLERQGEDIGEESDTVRNRLESIRSKMESVQDLIIRQKLSKENQSLQSEIIKDLKFFQTDQQKRNQKTSEQKKQESSKKGDQAATKSNTTGNPKADVTQSERQNAEIQKRIDEIWGHLPEQIRKNGLNIRSEQFLPKYRDLIKAYFKRLAIDPDIR